MSIFQRGKTLTSKKTYVSPKMHHFTDFRLHQSVLRMIVERINCTSPVLELKSSRN